MRRKMKKRRKWVLEERWECGRRKGRCWVRPVVMDLASKDYVVIVGNRELLRMGICLRGLPSSTRKREDD